MSEEKELIQKLLSSEVKTGLLVLLHGNPGLMDTAEGMALRLGRKRKAIEPDLQDFLDLGILKKRTIGDRQIYQLDRARDKEIQDALNHYFTSLDA